MFNQSLDIRVSVKKAVSIYGLQRFPITLYADQWIELAKRMPDILKFVEDHRGELSFKSGD